MLADFFFFFSCLPISNNTTKLWSSKQYGTGIKTGRSNRIERLEINLHTSGKLIHNKESKIWEKTASSINGVEKTRQLHAKQ